MKPMTPEQWPVLTYTIEHFKDIARQNRFAENSSIEHETGRCLVCHPELFPIDPIFVYLRVVTEAIKIRRPRLDHALVNEINSDLELTGEHARISREMLLAGDRNALRFWSQWVREALATGLGLLSVHSSTSREFTLEEAEARGLDHLLEAKIKDIMTFQMQNV
jgi:hypothetical protein